MSKNVEEMLHEHSELNKKNQYNDPQFLEGRQP